jgi:hypothetical protein
MRLVSKQRQDLLAKNHVYSQGRKRSLQLEKRLAQTGRPAPISCRYGSDQTVNEPPSAV